MRFMRLCKQNVIESVIPHMTIWRMRTSCWIPKATNTHSVLVLLIGFPLQHWLHEGDSMLRYSTTTGPLLFLLWWTHETLFNFG
jgi:hypothetical protein